MIDGMGGLIRDAVIVGEEADKLGALLWPFRPALEKRVIEGAGMTDQQQSTHCTLKAALARCLAAYIAMATGSFLRVPRFLDLANPLSLERGEVTDKDQSISAPFSDTGLT